MRFIRNSEKISEKLKTLDKAIIFPLGDVHTGASTAKRDEFMTYVKLASKLDNAFVYWMGDMMELGGRSSPGVSLFHQTMQPQEQYDWTVETIAPLAHKSIVYHGANHERRAEIATGIDITKNIAAALKIPYAALGAITRIVLANQAYTIHSFHGMSGARLPHTKIKAHKDATTFLENIDLMLMGHVHYNHAEKFVCKRPDLKNKRVENVFGYRVMTGHFLEWDESYGEERGYEPLPSGAPIIELDGLKHEIKIRSIEDF